jgi:tRNA (guanine37-N1)-methyltransferase
MWFGVVSIFPEMFRAFTDYGVTGIAVRSQKLALAFANPRDFAINAYGSVDDRPYGGGPGMVMRVEPMVDAVMHLQQLASPNVAHRILLSPQGRLLTQGRALELAKLTSIILVAGRYEGIDERVTKLVIDEEISVGDYVVSGGELPAMMLMDCIARLLPDVLGNKESVLQDSFAQPGLLDHPHYSRPLNYQGLSVPAVLLSGDHQAIAAWRLQQAQLRSQLRRPDLYQS